MKKLISVFCIMALAAVALAQPGPGGPGGPGRMGFGGPGFGFGRGMVGAMMLMSPDVQRELNLTQTQMQQIQQYMQQQRDQMQQLFPQMRDATPEQRQKLMEQVVQKQEEAIGKILTAEQRTRWRQLQLQAEGPIALRRADVAKELNLNEEQRKKINDISTQHMQKQMQLWQQARDQNIPPQTLAQQAQQMQQQLQKDLLAVLSADQQEQWKKMQGKPFEFQFPRGPGMGPGGRNPGQGAPR